MHASIAKLAIDWLSVIPFTIHPVLQIPSTTKLRAAAVIARFASYSAIDNYNTRAHASLFSEIFLGQFLSGDKTAPHYMRYQSLVRLTDVSRKG